ncbi:response regulator transcription factor [Actinokineospora terrae]|uniref:Two component transcriptional regulator, LuxR family n=1 Tax=Actinokineospora terrae TaxID=155974 RepID=A0A1H9NZD9_9PSEU|nr:response regulator transcription factor [Actinokineospora terrae]SER41187.1 two component transcriptional regulator, LuxR family [Actinokineospora terrae]
MTDPIEAPMTDQPVTVAIIEDHPVVVDGVTTWITTDPGKRAAVVASGDSIDEVLAGPGGDADVLLLDLQLGDTVVVDRVAQLCTEGRRVVVYSAMDDPGTILTVLEAGASAFLSKHEAGSHCVDTIVAVATDRPYVTPSVAGALLTEAPHLSVQERTALLLWFQSMSKASVARRMGLSEATVRQYIDRARVKYAKIGRPAPTKTALLARAIEDGLIRADEIGEYRSHAAGDQ